MSPVLERAGFGHNFSCAFFKCPQSEQRSGITFSPVLKKLKQIKNIQKGDHFNKKKCKKILQLQFWHAMFPNIFSLKCSVSQISSFEEMPLKLPLQ